MRTALAALAVLVCSLPAAHPAAGRGADRSASKRPEWLSSVPATVAGELFFLGVRSGALSLEEGKDGAFRDAASQTARFIRMRVSSKTLKRDAGLESRMFEEFRKADGGRLQGARLRDIYWERSRPGARGKGERYDVWVLVSFPEAEARRERARLEEAERVLEGKFDALCSSAVSALRSREPGAPIRLGTFLETAGKRRYGFSRVLEESLRSCLSAAGIPVAAGKAGLILSGAYRKEGESIPVSIRLSDGGGSALIAAEERFPLDAVEPSWLGEEDASDSFFAAPSQELSAAIPSFGAVSVKTEPQGARVFIDGVDRGLSPVVAMGLEPGVRSLALSLGGYVPHSQEVTVEAGGKASVEARLERETALLTVLSEPRGAQVFVNDELKGRTPWSDNRIPTGEYLVRLKLENYKHWERAAVLAYGSKEEMKAALEEEDGSLFVIVEPPGSDIFLDGRRVGDSAQGRPLKLSAVAAGEHEVSARKEGREEGRWRVRVRARKTATVTGSLVAARPPRKPAPERESWLSAMKEVSAPAFRFRLPRFERPASMTYGELLGAGAGGGLTNFRFGSGAYYFWDSRVGLGTTVVSTYERRWDIQRIDTLPSPGIPARPPRPVGVRFTSVFPLQLYLVPIAHRYQAMGRERVASAQFYLNWTAWARSEVDDPAISDSNTAQAPSASLLDYGLMLHSGTYLSFRVGWLDANLPSFSAGRAGFGGLRDKRFYAAVDLSLGWFNTNPGG